MSDKKKIHCPHDKGYKSLLKNKTFFLQLLQSFVKLGWVNEVDYDNMLKVDKSYVLQDFDGKEADLVYRLKILDRDVILYVLMELQSTVDYDMSFRLLEYMVLIWQDLRMEAKEQKIKGYNQPAILPIVLYNGKEKWTASMSFKETLIGYEYCGDFGVDLKYVLIDVNRIDINELEKLANLIAGVFMLDQNINPPEFMNRTVIVKEILRRNKKREVNLFKNWLNKIGMRDMPQDYKDEVLRIIESDKPKEVGNMLPVFENVKNEGKLEGKLEGDRDGREDVARNMLIEGCDVEFVAKVTRLTLDDVRGLKRKIDN